MTHKLLILALLLLAGSVLVFAGNEGIMGVGKINTVTFNQPMKVGTSVLPEGTYRVVHVMEAENHIMVFTSKDKRVPEVRVRCKMENLPARAIQGSILYERDASGVAVLNRLVFRGDTYSHNF
jgi:hypothetical protein